uniref:Uncharacterized protein n=1 Tax=Caenorhabditis japonica TaxID=281687 RepID=A0A8R1DQA9_CAEJA
MTKNNDSSKSTRKSQQRSRSVSTSRSKTSKSASSPSAVQKNVKASRAPLTIYAPSQKPEEPDLQYSWPREFNTGLHLSAIAVLVLAIIYNMLFNNRPNGCSIINALMSLPTIYAFVTVVHFFIAMQSMEVIGLSEKSNDFSHLIIVESIEKRKRDVHKMVSLLMADVVEGDGDMDVNLMVKDETGQPMKLSGAGVEAGVKRTVQMKVGADDVELVSSNTAAASIAIPKKKVEPAPKVPLVKVVFDSIYNRCQKQENLLSPRRVL